MTNDMMDLDLSIIIANWNTGGYLAGCVDSIREKSRGFSYEIIVVDNASTDGSPDLIKAGTGDLRIIREKVNHGFGRANNIGLKAARGRWICFLNPDTVLVNNALGLMLANQKLKDGRVKAAGPKILNADRTVQRSCARKLPGPGLILYSFTGLERLPFFPSQERVNCPGSFDEVREVPAVSGACLMVDRSTAAETGGFDENYFMYGEDLDLCFALRSGGQRILYDPEAVIIHYGGVSSRQASAAMAEASLRSWHFYLSKHHGSRAAALFFPAVKAIYLLRLVLYAPGAPFSKGCRARLKLFTAILKMRPGGDGP